MNGKWIFFFEPLSVQILVVEVAQKSPSYPADSKPGKIKEWKTCNINISMAAAVPDITNLYDILYYTSIHVLITLLNILFKF